MGRLRGGALHGALGVLLGWMLEKEAKRAGGSAPARNIIFPGVFLGGAACWLLGEVRA